MQTNEPLEVDQCGCEADAWAGIKFATIGLGILALILLGVAIGGVR